MINFLKKIKLYFYLCKCVIAEVCLYKILYHGGMYALGSDLLLVKNFNRIKRRRFYKNASKIAVYGAGKHTIRLLNLDLISSAKIVAIFDDDKNKTSFMGFPVYPLEKSADVDFDLLIISSDVYEEKMYRAAIELVPANRTLVKIYKFEKFSRR